MTTRSGGRYEVRNGKPVLVERTGWTPPKKDAPKPAKQEESNADS